MITIILHLSSYFFFYCLFFLSSAYSDLILQLTYGPTKERPVPTTLVGLIHIQYNRPKAGFDNHPYKSQQL